MTDIETGIMIKNMAREMVERATVKNASLMLSRKQYDKMIDNKAAVVLYLKCKHAWSLSGVTITGDDEALNIIRVAAGA